MGGSISRLTAPRRQLLGALLVSAALIVLYRFSPLPSIPFLPFPPSLPHDPLDPALTSSLESLYAGFLQHCPTPSPHLPVHLVPSLTKAQAGRYAHLRSPSSSLQSKAYVRRGQGKYLIVTNIRDIAATLPDLLSTLLVLVRFLRPERLSFSILEGPSGDCTPDVLEQVLLPTLLAEGVQRSDIRLETRLEKIDFNAGNRIEILAGLRNRALAPLWADNGLDEYGREARAARREGGSTVGQDVMAVLFLNDVFLRAGDVLELLHQHMRAGEKSGRETGVTTGWDWMERSPAYYYDVWVGRTADTGDLFYPIDWPWWSPSDALFHNSSASRAAFDRLEPFPAFSSWNGLAVMSPTPFLPPHNVRFRRGDARRGECAASECSLVCGDFWRAGWGRVQVVPSVQLAYTEKVAKETRDALDKQQAGLGWKDGVPPKSLDSTVVWPDRPPERVRCHPWPDENGLSHNVWAKTEWVAPYLPEGGE